MNEAKAAANSVFDKLDADHDGTLDHAELKGRVPEQDWGTADPDSDKTLTKDEYLNYTEFAFRRAACLCAFYASPDLTTLCPKRACEGAWAPRARRDRPCAIRHRRVARRDRLRPRCGDSRRSRARSRSVDAAAPESAALIARGDRANGRPDTWPRARVRAGKAACASGRRAARSSCGRARDRLRPPRASPPGPEIRRRSR